MANDNITKPEDPHVEGGQVVGGNAEKDPKDWVSGGEAMTGAQMSYLKTLSDEAKVEFDENLTKGEASARIDELKTQLGK
ncbi:DUF3072 domain-containing protein [bacterium]|nr:MAG: DUF3072 domain-containing protein [bacterium]